MHINNLNNFFICYKAQQKNSNNAHPFKATKSLNYQSCKENVSFSALPIAKKFLIQSTITEFLLSKNISFKGNQNISNNVSSTETKDEKFDMLLKDLKSHLSNFSKEYQLIPKHINCILNATTPENIHFAKELVNIIDNEGNPKFSWFDIVDILENVPPQKCSLLKSINNWTDKNGKNRFNKSELITIIKNLSSEDVPKLKELSDLRNNTNKPRFMLKELLFYTATNANIKNLDEKIATQIKLMKKEPEKYINGKYSTKNEMLAEINNFIRSNYELLTLSAALLDKESFNNLMRMRLELAREHMRDFMTLLSIDHQALILFKELSNSRTIDGKEFCGNQKIDLLKLILAYKQCNLPFDKIKTMIKTKKVDIKEINYDLLNKLIQNIGLSINDLNIASKERLNQCDLSLIHLLTKEINNPANKSFKKLLKLAILSDDFKKNIHNTNTIYGKANNATKKRFENSKMNYEGWITPSKENEIRFKTKDTSIEKFAQISEELLKDIDTLRNIPFIKKHIDANFQRYLKDDEFIIPPYIVSNKEQLMNFTDTFIKKLDKFWLMAEKNLENPNLELKAKKTLAVLENLKQKIETIKRTETNTYPTKRMDLTIKMWDRNPIYDIFQGSYSTCCIALDKKMRATIPYYLTNTSLNMIEIINNQTGKTIGNSLCFFAKDENNQTIFVLDNIEINNRYRLMNETGINLRNAIVQYASKITKEVTGKNNIPIYIGNSYNDVPTEDLTLSNKRISIFGGLGIEKDEEIYLDIYNGWIEKSNFINPVKLLRLK